MTHNFLIIVFSALLVPGIIMAILPALPGLFYMMAVAIVYGIFDHFTTLTLGNIGVLAVIVALATGVDVLSGVVGAKWGGAHWKSIWAGLVGLLVGTFVIPIPLIGSIAGLFLGVLFSEWHRTRSVRLAKRAAIGSLIGSIAGMTVNGIAGVTFLALFIFFAMS